MVSGFESVTGAIATSQAVTKSLTPKRDTVHLDLYPGAVCSIRLGQPVWVYTETDCNLPSKMLKLIDVKDN